MIAGILACCSLACQHWKSGWRGILNCIRVSASCTSFMCTRRDETRWLLQERWNHLGMHIQVDDFTDQEALATIVRITAGNFRVIHRLLMQVERILQINSLHTVTKEVVETARESLVLGQ